MSTLAFTIRNDSSILFNVTPTPGAAFQVSPRATSASQNTDASYLVTKDQSPAADQFTVILAPNNLKIKKTASTEGATVTVTISGAAPPPPGP